MIIECEVWKQNGEIVYVGNFGWNKMWKERQMIDTDLFDWFTGVTITKTDYGYPYKNQCRVAFKESGKYPLIVDVDTVTKIRTLLGKKVIRI